MGSRVELFEQIRRDRDREGLSIRALAARHGVHRRAVRQALASPLPPVKRSPARRPAPKLGAYRALIDEWLEADREAPRKQRHTAKRIWQRLVDEHGAEVAETTVRDYVRARRRAMGWPVGEVFVPQVHAPGVEAEVDWGEAQVELAGTATTVHLFLMRASFSGAAFCQASLVETQQAFLEPHVAGVRVVRRRVRADPLRQPALGGQAGAARAAGASRATASSRCARTTCSSRSSRRRASRARTRRAASRARSGASGATTSSRSRRSPTWPSSTSCCWPAARPTCARRIGGRPVTVGEAWTQERPLLRALPAEPFDAAEAAAPRVDSKALVTVRQNRYSVPVALAGLRVSARIGAREITISHAGAGGRAPRAAARPLRHQRRSSTTTSSCSRASPAGWSTRWRSPRSASAAPGPRLRRAVGSDRRSLRRSEAARQMVDVLMLCREHGPEPRRAGRPRRARRRRARRPRGRRSSPAAPRAASRARHR